MSFVIRTILQHSLGKDCVVALIDQDNRSPHVRKVKRSLVTEDYIESLDTTNLYYDPVKSTDHYIYLHQRD